MKIPRSYYRSDDVVFLAKDLLGKTLLTRIDGELSGGIITETEAYGGITDRASHAYGGRRTKRTEIMFQTGGVSYIYLCYGMHYLFNIVTGEKDIPHAVLIRAIYPSIGLDIVKNRRKKIPFYMIANGPGKVTKSLGLTLKQNGEILQGDNVWLEDNPLTGYESEIIVSKRIGIDYAGPDALLPYRFLLDIKKAPQ